MDKLTNNPKTNYLLGELGIFNAYQLINYLPRKYEDFSLSKKEDFLDKARVVINGTVSSEISEKETNKSKIVSFTVLTSFRSVKVIAFNRSYLSKIIKSGDNVTISGIYDYKFNQINLISLSKGEIEEDKTLKAIYKLPYEISNYQFSRLVKNNLELLKGKICSPIPYFYKNKYRLISKEDALNKIHFPKNKEDIHQALRTLKYEEALTFSLKNLLIRENNRSLVKVKKEPIDISLCLDLINDLPFKLTSDQELASKEIIDDMNDSSLMYRLLQGDVGSGKTIVSFISLYANYKRGDQGALLAPTEALARQHYESAINIFKNTKVKIALLLGSTSQEDKKRIYKDLEDGYIDLIIGTHALFTKSIKYSSLGLVVIDEQHRFGVNQRIALLDKGVHADLLMMSATPIPRSLALSIYGDLAISTLNSFPSKSKNIVTKIVKSNDENIFKEITKSLENNKRIYIVAPKIIYEENGGYSVDELFSLFNKKFPTKVGLLHGNLKSNEKEEVLNEFILGDKPILVSTTVIEVGIDVKDADLMLIYDASNFGLASLHQLRGRIGRDGSISLCLLINDGKEENERLEILTKTLDGFKIAESDLSSRGPGDLAGLKQSGLPEFTYLNIIKDIAIFVTARDDAKYIYSNRNKDKGFKYIIDVINKAIEKEEVIKG